MRERIISEADILRGFVEGNYTKGPVEDGKGRTSYWIYFDDKGSFVRYIKGDIEKKNGLLIIGLKEQDGAKVYIVDYALNGLDPEDDGDAMVIGEKGLFPHRLLSNEKLSLLNKEYLEFLKAFNITLEKKKGVDLIKFREMLRSLLSK